MNVKNAEKTWGESEMESTEFKSILASLDLDLRHGRAQLAKKQLLSLELRKIPREYLVSFAQVARRLNLPEVILKLLGPVVRPKLKGSTQHENQGSDAEKALYAVGLTRMGAYTEARSLLENVDFKKFPEAILFLAHVEIFNWNYELASDYLWEYRKKIRDPYQVLVCDLNLSAAYLHSGRYEDFIYCASRASEIAKNGGHILIYGNFLELIGQYYCLRGEFDRAVESLENAYNKLTEAPAQYLLFVRKWKSISQYLKNPQSEDAYRVLLQFRGECLERKEWDTLRECDLFLAMGAKDKEAFEKIFFGTPLVGYQRKMQRLADQFFFDPKLNKNTLIFSRAPLSGVLGQTISVSKWPSGALGQLLKVLMKDHYRPLLVGEIFSEVYPNEYFSQSHSNERIFKLTSRLRRWMKENELPLEIVVVNKRYFLRATSVVKFNYFEHENLAIGNAKIRGSELQKQNLILVKNQFENNFFSVGELAGLLSISPSGVRRWLAWAKKLGLVKGGNGTGWKKYRMGRQLGA